MANQVKIWFEEQTDFLEVLFSEKAGFMRESEYDIIMERVDENGNILGFFVMPFSMINDEPSALFHINKLWLKAGNNQNDFEKLLIVTKSQIMAPVQNINFNPQQNHHIDA